MSELLAKIRERKKHHESDCVGLDTHGVAGYIYDEIEWLRELEELAEKEMTSLINPGECPECRSTETRIKNGIFRCFSCEYCPTIKDALTDTLFALKEAREQGWRRVEDEEPTVSGAYLTRWKDVEKDPEGSVEYWHEDDGWADKQVYWWMPIPKLPEVKDE